MILNKAAGIGRIVLIGDDFRSIVAVKPIIGAKPHKALIVLQSADNGRRGESVIKGQLFELKYFLLRKGRGDEK
jgi:hypothetical protein